MARASRARLRSTCASRRRWPDGPEARQTLGQEGAGPLEVAGRPGHLAQAPERPGDAVLVAHLPPDGQRLLEEGPRPLRVAVVEQRDARGCPAPRRPGCGCRGAGRRRRSPRRRAAPRRSRPAARASRPSSRRVRATPGRSLRLPEERPGSVEHGRRLVGTPRRPGPAGAPASGTTPRRRAGPRSRGRGRRTPLAAPCAAAASPKKPAIIPAQARACARVAGGHAGARQRQQALEPTPAPHASGRASARTRAARRRGAAPAPPPPARGAPAPSAGRRGSCRALGPAGRATAAGPAPSSSGAAASARPV